GQFLFVDDLAGPAIAAVVHAEIDGEDGWLVSEHVAFEAAVAAAGGIAADADVAKDEVVLREACLAPQLEVVAIEPLLGDAVSHDDDDIAFFQEEFLRRGSGRGGKQDAGRENEREITPGHENVLSM